MIDFFIISNASRAASYGIGTYSDQIVSCLESVEGVRINHIEMFSDSREYEKECDEKGYVHFKIPVLSGSIEDEASCKNAFYFLSQHLASSKSGSYVFLFNYFQHYQLAALLKVAYPSSRIILAIHYLNWCFSLKGNEVLFRQYIMASSEDEGDSDGTSLEIDKKIRADYELEREFMRLADHVIALAKSTRKTLIEDYGINEGKIELIANGIPQPRASSPNESTESAFNDADIRYMLFVGRLDDIKGVTYLVKAFKRLCSEHTNLHLIIVGDGDFSSCMAAGEGYWDKMTFTGKVSKEALEHIYSKVSLGILPSFHEQCSYAAIEMMAHGIPIVISDSTGLKEMMEDLPSCIVQIDRPEFVEDKFVDRLYDTINSLLSDRVRLEEASIAAKDIYVKRYTQAIMRERYLELLQRRNAGIYSEDLLSMIDNKMFRLIDSRPDIDTEFYGMTGIGCYLWHRIKCFKSEPVLSALLKQYFDNWMEWMCDMLTEASSNIPAELSYLVNDMKEHGYSYDRIKDLTTGRNRNVDDQVGAEDSILSNALRIFLCKI